MTALILTFTDILRGKKVELVADPARLPAYSFTRKAQALRLRNTSSNPKRRRRPGGPKNKSKKAMSSPCRWSCETESLRRRGAVGPASGATIPIPPVRRGLDAGHDKKKDSTVKQPVRRSSFNGSMHDLQLQHNDDVPHSCPKRLLATTVEMITSVLNDLDFAEEETVCDGQVDSDASGEREIHQTDCKDNGRSRKAYSQKGLQAHKQRSYVSQKESQR